MIYEKWTFWKDEVVERVEKMLLQWPAEADKCHEDRDIVVGVSVQFDLFPAFDELVVFTKAGKVFKALLNKGLSELEFVEIQKDGKPK